MSAGSWQGTPLLVELLEALEVFDMTVVSLLVEESFRSGNS